MFIGHLRVPKTLTFQSCENNYVLTLRAAFLTRLYLIYVRKFYTCTWVGGGGLLPYISYIGMYRPIGSGFCAVLV